MTDLAMKLDSSDARQTGALAALRFALQLIEENDRYRVQELLKACIGYSEQVMSGDFPAPPPILVETIMGDEAAA